MTKHSAPKKSTTCRQVVAHLKKPEWRDWDVLPQAIRSHLNTCSACRCRYASLRTTLTIFGTRVNVPLPPEWRHHVEERLRLHEEESSLS